ncbi:MAG: hypothetical protein U0235_15070 [Polyangiaceae bacterium]
MTQEAEQKQASLYDRLGGKDAIRAVVDRLYALISEDSSWRRSSARRTCRR